MTDILLRKQLGTLVPADEAARAALAKLPHGGHLLASLRRPRNIGHHRKLFALLNLVVENQEHYRSVDHLLAAIKVATGHADIYPMADGNTAFVPKSISFAAMDQAAFAVFWEQTVNFITTKVLPGLDRAALEAEVLELVA